MRLIIFSPHYGFDINPRKIRIDNLIKELKNKCSITLLTQRGKIDPEKEIEIISFHTFIFNNSTTAVFQYQSKLGSILKKVFWPDIFIFHAIIYWIYYILFKRKEGDILLTISTPFSMHIAGLVNTLFNDNVWIADIGDVYFDNPILKSSLWLNNKLNFILERTVLKKAKRIVVNSEAMRSHYVENWKLNPEKILAIPNGIRINPENIIHKVKEPIVLSYIGNTYEKIREGIEETRVLLNLLTLDTSLQIHYVGKCYSPLYDLIREHTFARNFHLYKADAIEALEAAYSQSDFLIYLANRKYVNRASKVQEYLESKKPILFFYYEEVDLLVYPELPKEGIMYIKINNTDPQSILNFMENHIGYIRNVDGLNREGSSWDLLLKEVHKLKSY